MSDEAPPPASEEERCASCGKIPDGGSLKTCTSCKQTRYCGVSCQRSHWPKHKKACKRRAAELYDEALFRAPPKNVECPICCLPVQHESEMTTYKTCCGKLLCCGCILGVTEQSLLALNPSLDVCPFCRCQKPASDLEDIQRLRKRMECNDGYAFNTTGSYHESGSYGLSLDLNKAKEMWLRAGENGCPFGYFNLGNANNKRGDTKKARHYWGLAAMAGDGAARYNLGGAEGRAGNVERSIRHFMIGARAGHNKCLDAVKECYVDGDVTKDEYAQALRSYQESVDEMKSEGRDKAGVIERSMRSFGMTEW